MELSTFQFSDHVLGFIANSKVDSSLLKKVHNDIDEALKTFERISWYCENASGDKISFGAIMEDVGYKLKHCDRFEKIAVVSDQTLESIMANLEDLFLEAEVRFFKISDRSDALLWVADYSYGH